MGTPGIFNSIFSSREEGPLKSASAGQLFIIIIIMKIKAWLYSTFLSSDNSDSYINHNNLTNKSPTLIKSTTENTEIPKNEIMIKREYAAYIAYIHMLRED